MKVRRFLLGLSCDELQFIAGYMGACILESLEYQPRQSSGWDTISEFSGNCACRNTDHDRKMILLWEYLCRSRNHGTLPAVRSGQA